MRKPKIYQVQALGEGSIDWLLASSPTSLSLKAGLPLRVFFLADRFAVMDQPRAVAKLRKWIHSLKKKKNLTWKKKSTAQRKPQTTFSSQVKITLVLSTLWNYFYTVLFDSVDNKKDKRKLIPLTCLWQITKVSICYYSIKIHETYDIHMYFFFPEMLLWILTAH